MSEILLDYKPYILNDANMQNYLKYKSIELSENKKTKKIKSDNINTNINSIISPLYIPRENDSLFWCYYIIKNGDIQYEMLQNRNTLTTRQLKIGMINKIRENQVKKLLKTYKFDSLTNIESNLANDNIITLNIFLTICLVDNINIVFVTKHTYYELLTNDSNIIYIIREIDNSRLKYNKQYGYEIADEDKLNNIRSNLYNVDTPNKPIKSLSAYKLSELLIIANKLAIEVINKETGKNKTKQQLYELIIQYF